MTLRWVGWALVFCCAPSCAWEEDAPAQPYVTLQELDQTAQPTTASLGVLVAVLASGGNAVRLDVQGGTFDDGPGPDCTLMPNGSGAFVVAVHPLASEATVTATLGNNGTVEGGPAPSPDAAGAGDASMVASSILCGGLGFESLGATSTLVVSLGRAPAPMGAADAGAPEAGEDAEAGAPTDDGGDAGPGLEDAADGPSIDAPSDTAANLSAIDGGDAQ